MTLVRVARCSKAGKRLNVQRGENSEKLLAHDFTRVEIERTQAYLGPICGRGFLRCGGASCGHFPNYII